jgi:glycine betaine catabolism A
VSDQTPMLMSPRLDHCPASFPSEVYRDPARYQLEIERIFARSWVYVGRTADLKINVMKRVSVAGQGVILLKDEGGSVRAFRNVCRHRGSELCVQDEQPLKGKLITCPYHAWAYASDGRLLSTAFARPTKDFDKGENGLIPVALHLWNGLVFACLSDAPPDFAKVPDVGPWTLDNWPIETLVTGYRQQTVVSCNWKVFWENYSECLHCPGIHSMLSDFVPVYSKGIMAANEAYDWTPDQPAPTSLLKDGARSWTMNGQPCGPEFPNLTESERLAGYTFVTLWPSCFVVAHSDYVRVVTVTPLTPETTQLTAEWLFPQETLDQPDFDLKNVTNFATTVLMEDAAACEMNQRGLATPGFQGRLMPEEYEIHRFHQWVEEHLR